jgi:hypothetical protein
MATVAQRTSSVIRYATTGRMNSLSMACTFEEHCNARTTRE